MQDQCDLEQVKLQESVSAGHFRVVARPNLSEETALSGLKKLREARVMSLHTAPVLFTC
jgi:hypothetical protein